MRFSCGVLDKQCFVNVILLKCQYRGTMLMHHFLPSWAMLDMQSLHSRQFSRISLCIDCLSVWKSRQMRQVPFAPKNQRASMNLWFDCVFFLPRQGLKSRFHIQMDILENYHLIACGQRALCVVQVRPRQKQPGYIYLLRLDGLSLVWPGLSLFLLNVGGTAFLVVSSTSFSLIAGPKPNINNKS